MSNLAGFSFNFLDKNAFKPYSIGIGWGDAEWMEKNLIV